MIYTANEVPNAAARSIAFRSALGALESEYNAFREAIAENPTNRTTQVVAWIYHAAKVEGIRKTIDVMMLMVDRFEEGETHGFWARYREIEQAMADALYKVVSTQGLDETLRPYILPDIARMAKPEDTEENFSRAEQDYESRREGYARESHCW